MGMGGVLNDEQFSRSTMNEGILRGWWEMHMFVSQHTHTHTQTYVGNNEFAANILTYNNLYIKGWKNHH